MAKIDVAIPSLIAAAMRMVCTSLYCTTVNRQIRVTAGKYRGKFVKLWKVVDVADN